MYQIDHHLKMFANNIIFIRTNEDYLDHWIGEVQKYSPEAEIIVVENKIDISHVEVTEDELKSFCLKKQFNYCLCSAKDGTNVDECFNKLAQQILNNGTLMNLIKERETFKLNANNTQQESS